MARRVPDVPAPAWREPEGGAVERSVRLRLLTPMFGGGHTPREVDPHTPVRTATVRGHLRFWWRATRGSGFDNQKALLDSEAKVWGTASCCGAVSVRVEIEKAGAECKLEELRSQRVSPRDGPLLGYFLFPFEASAAKDVVFRVNLSFPERFREDVETALRGWIAFGGVGARTRRGCGALRAEDDWALQVHDLQALLRPADHASQPVTHTTLAGARLLLGPQTSDPIEAWRALARAWARFRKGHVPPQPYEPTQSGRWRDYTILSQAVPSKLPDPVPLAKPYLGLPIIYQSFPPRRQGPPHPFVGPLEPEQSGRMASPIILKPMQIGDCCRPAVLVLSAPPPRAVRLQGMCKALKPPDEDPVLKSLNARDPIQAVCHFFQKLDYQLIESDLGQTRATGIGK